MMRVTLRIIVFIVCLTLLGSPAQAKNQYKKTLKQWTRHERVFSKQDFHISLDWYATLLDESMIEAMAQKHAKTYKLPSYEEDAIKEKLLNKTEDQVLFFVSFYAPFKIANDLLKKEGHWDLRMEVGGQIYRPTKIEKVKKLTLLEDLYYPYIMHPWAQGYYVWFSKDVLFSSRPWKLSLYNPEAHSILTW